jgi:hypothetical protein
MDAPIFEVTPVGSWKHPGEVIFPFGEDLPF